MAISIQKILESNLPNSVDEDVILFTDVGNIYVNRTDGTLAKMGGSGGSSSGGSSDGSLSCASDLECITKLPSTAPNGRTVLYITDSLPIMCTFYNGTWYGQGLTKMHYIKEFITAEQIALFESDGAQAVVVEDTTISDFYSRVKVNNRGETSKQYSIKGTFTTGSGVVRIPWKVSSETNYDYGYISIDDIQVVSASGEQSGTIYKYLDAGEHTLKISYKSDSSNTRGEDAISVWGIEYYK